MAARQKRINVVHGMSLDPSGGNTEIQWHPEQGMIWVKKQPKTVQFANDKRRVEITAGPDLGELGFVWFKDGHPERRVGKEGHKAWGRKKGKYLMVTFDSGFTKPIRKHFIKFLHELEQLYLEADEDFDEPAPRLEDMPEVSSPKPTAERKELRPRPLGSPPRLEDL
jgi:hypothetical protein